MKLSFACRWTGPGIWTRSIVIVVILVVVYRVAPEAVIPVGLGGWLGSWLTRPASSVAVLPAGRT
jgi:hypothetical protein